MEYNLTQYHKILSSALSHVERKIFINSYYPIVGESQFRFFDPVESCAITKTAHEIMSRLTDVEPDTTDLQQARSNSGAG